MGVLLLNGNRVSTYGNEKVLETDSNDGCTTLCMYLMPLNCTLKNGLTKFCFIDIYLTTT